MNKYSKVAVKPLNFRIFYGCLVLFIFTVDSMTPTADTKNYHRVRPHSNIHSSIPINSISVQSICIKSCIIRNMTPMCMGNVSYANRIHAFHQRRVWHRLKRNYNVYNCEAFMECCVFCTSTHTLYHTPDRLYISSIKYYHACARLDAMSEQFFSFRENFLHDLLRVAGRCLCHFSCTMGHS